MSAAEPYDDPFPEIIEHGGFSNAEKSVIARIEELMELVKHGGPAEGPILLTMSLDQAKRLQNVLHHALNHGCEEGIRALYSWLRQVVKPALDGRLGGDGSSNDGD